MERLDLEKGVVNSQDSQRCLSSASGSTKVETQGGGSSKLGAATQKGKVSWRLPSWRTWRQRRKRLPKATKTERPLRKKDDPFRQAIVKPVHEGPLGFPLLARFLNSDDNYMTYRRFGNVQTRLLLEAQDDMHHLEEQLEELDEDETTTDKKALCRRENGTKWSVERQDLMKKLKVAFKEYADLISSAQMLTSLNKPAKAEYKSVESFINNEKPVINPEFSWIYHQEDLITFRPGREYAWLDAQVERALRFFKCKLIRRIFCSEETARKAQGSPTGCEMYFTRSRIEACVNVIITFTTLGLMIVPIWLLYHLTTIPPSGIPHINAACIMGVLLVFTLLFSAGMSFFSRAKRHEILAASAAYCAVLVVFVGNINSGRAMS